MSEWRYTMTVTIARVRDHAEAAAPESLWRRTLGLSESRLFLASFAALVLVYLGLHMRSERPLARAGSTAAVLSAEKPVLIDPAAEVITPLNVRDPSALVMPPSLTPLPRLPAGEDIRGRPIGPADEAGEPGRARSDSPIEGEDPA